MSEAELKVILGANWKGDSAFLKPNCFLWFKTVSMERPQHMNIFRPSALLQAYLNESTTAGRKIEASCLKFMGILLYLNTGAIYFHYFDLLSI